MTDATGASDASGAQETSEDVRLWREEMRSLVSGVDLVVLIAAVVLAVWGILDSLTDADGDRFWGNFTIAAPGIYAGWCMLEIAWKKLAHVGTVLLRLVSACFIAPALAALPIAVIQLILIAFPGVRDAITQSQAQNGGFHYWWNEGIASQLFLVPLGSYAIGACIPLGVALIIVLPIISIRAPQVAAQGSHIEKVEGSKQFSTTAFVFCGLGAITLGIILWVFGEGRSILDFPEYLGRFIRTMEQGYVYWEDGMWLLGVVCVVVGVGLMGWGCIRVLFARGAAARG